MSGHLPADWMTSGDASSEVIAYRAVQQLVDAHAGKRAEEQGPSSRVLTGTLRHENKHSSQ
jgi:hypothetical protein